MSTAVSAAPSVGGLPAGVTARPHDERDDRARRDGSHDRDGDEKPENEGAKVDRSHAPNVVGYNIKGKSRRRSELRAQSRGFRLDARATTSRENHRRAVRHSTPAATARR